MSAATFNATTADQPLWATVQGHPKIWIRWTAAHEELVESEQEITFGNRLIGYEVVGRIVRGSRLGEWQVSNWRPKCATCHGTRMVELHPDRDAFYDMIMACEGGLFYMVEALVACPDCRAHPGWVVG